MKHLGFVTFLVCLVLVGTSYAADFNKGSLGGNKSKFYNFTSLDDGHVTVTVIFDKSAANVDIGLGIEDQLVSASVSTQRGFEQLKAGTVSGTSWTVLLLNQNSAGTSFRLIVEGAVAEDISKGAALSSEYSSLEKQLRKLGELMLRLEAIK